MLKATPHDGHSSPRLEALPPTYFFAPDLEREINRLDGVKSARVLSTGVQIDEIHVLGWRERAPKKIVRDIESLLLLRFGIRIDHRCISVVQLEQTHDHVPQSVRPRIQDVKIEEGTVRVTLGIGDNTIIGEAAAANEDEVLLGVSRAVVHAVEQLLDTPGVLTVVNCQVARMEEYRIVHVLVSWAFAEQREYLLGASLVQNDVFETAARATLDAVNRRLVRFQAAGK